VEALYSEAPGGPGVDDLAGEYRRVRALTEALVDGLSDADLTVQSMADASPAKWHLAHTTWFFETFVLRDRDPGRSPFHPAFPYLFNSYYESEGARQPRPLRGMLTRPTAGEVLDYRRHVDGAMLSLLERVCDPALRERIVLGLNHEQQHQELMVTDLLHLFAQNPLRPAFASGEGPAAGERPAAQRWIAQQGGIRRIGAGDEGFAFDCERPRHDTLLRPYRLASRTVTNGEWMAFIEDGGYRTPTLWLSDGWTTVQQQGWEAPLYWERHDGEWWTMTPHGLRPVDPAAPVTHVSYYEADAFAQWAGARLPTEAEWECAAADESVDGNLLESGRLSPRPAPDVADGIAAMFGDVWEWTASPYVGYPGYRAPAGAIGEYNGKFMCGQFVLRGGSCATPRGHVRPSYRNFFYPHQRWQFTGVRLAADG